MSDTPARVSALLLQAETTARLPATHTDRVPQIILEHAELRAMLLEQQAYADGLTHEHLRLIELVFELVGTVTGASNGRASWMTEIPAGTAPHFRRALNKLLAHMRGEQHD